MIAPGASCSRQFPSKPSQLLQLAQQCLAHLIIRLVEDQAADHLINGVFGNFDPGHSMQTLQTNAYFSKFNFR